MCGSRIQKEGRKPLTPEETPIEDARSAYRDIQQGWPWPLPPGYALPAESLRLCDQESTPWWYNPFSEVYETWRAATAVAALAAHGRGDDESFRSNLELIRKTYSSPLREKAIIDPDHAYIADAIDTAILGDFRTIMQTDVQWFLDEPRLAEIARDAGDFPKGDHQR